MRKPFYVISPRGEKKCRQCWTTSLYSRARNKKPLVIYSVNRGWEKVLMSLDVMRTRLHTIGGMWDGDIGTKSSSAISSKSGTPVRTERSHHVGSCQRSISPRPRHTHEQCLWHICIVAVSKVQVVIS